MRGIPGCRDTAEHSCPLHAASLAAQIQVVAHSRKPDKAFGDKITMERRQALKPDRQGYELRPSH